MGYTAEEIEQAQQNVLELLQIEEMLTGDWTANTLIGYFNGLPVYARTILSEEQLVWLEEILEEVEEEA